MMKPGSLQVPSLGYQNPEAVMNEKFPEPQGWSPSPFHWWQLQPKVINVLCICPPKNYFHVTGLGKVFFMTSLSRYKECKKLSRMFFQRYPDRLKQHVWMLIAQVFQRCLISRQIYPTIFREFYNVRIIRPFLK